MPKMSIFDCRYSLATVVLVTLGLGCDPSPKDPGFPAAGEMRLISATPVGVAAQPLNPNSDFSDYYAGSALPTGYQHAIPEKLGSVRRGAPPVEDAGKDGLENRFVAVQEWLNDDNALSPEQRFHTALRGLKAGAPYVLECTASHPADALVAINLHVKVGEELKPVQVPALRFHALTPGPESVQTRFVVPESGDLVVSSDVLTGSAIPTQVNWYAWKVLPAGSGLHAGGGAATPVEEAHVTALFEFGRQNGGISGWVKSASEFRTAWEGFIADQKEQPGDEFSTPSGVLLRKSDLEELRRSNFVYAATASPESRPVSASFTALRRIDAIAQSQKVPLLVVLVPSRACYLANVAHPVTDLLSVEPQRILYALALCDAGLAVYDVEAAMRAEEQNDHPPYAADSLSPTSAALDVIAKVVAKAVATDGRGEGAVLLTGQSAGLRDGESTDIAARLEKAKLGAVKVLHGGKSDVSVPGLIAEDPEALAGARALVFLVDSASLAREDATDWAMPQAAGAGMATGK